MRPAGQGFCSFILPDGVCASTPIGASTGENKKLTGCVQGISLFAGYPCFYPIRRLDAMHRPARAKRKVMTMRSTFVAVSILACLAGWTAQAGPARIQYGVSAGQGGELVGGSFIPPVGTGWKQSRNDAAGVDLVKAGASERENQHIGSELIQVDQPELTSAQYAPILRQALEAGAAKGPLKLLSLEITPDAQGRNCLRGRVLKMRAATDTDPAWYSERFFLSCRFAAIKGAGTNLSVYQRYFEGHQDPNFAAMANAVLNSFQLADQK